MPMDEQKRLDSSSGCGRGLTNVEGFGHEDCASVGVGPGAGGGGVWE